MMPFYDKNMKKDTNVDIIGGDQFFHVHRVILISLYISLIYGSKEAFFVRFFFFLLKFLKLVRGYSQKK